MSFRRRALVLALGLAACHPGERDRAPQGPLPPEAEFLVAAGDSTFWVRTTADGIRLRGSSLMLARFGGDFYEVYTADDDRSFYDALFVGQRVYRRDLVSGDSVLVYRDSIVPAAEHRWARLHPDEAPLLPDEEASDHPSASATAEVDLLDVHDAFLSVEHRTDIDVGGVRHLHRTVRRVVNLRERRDATVSDVFGDAAGAKILRDARALLAQARDSIRDERDPRTETAREAAADLIFDPRSFSLGDRDGAPSVTFVVPETGDLATGATLPLAPIRTAAPAWWPAVASTLPATRDSAEDAWRGKGYVVRARYDTTGDQAALVIADGAGREWPLGKVPAPVRHLLWLDAPAIDSTQRAALERAFDDAVLYDDQARVASSRRMNGTRLAALRRRPRGVRIVPVSRVRPRALRARRRHIPT
ncbi:MAG: hypothetical protein HOQ09_04720 [Gemmatimonadaceae bacterium]|nr:hypothetical protein [Gemmatimonadaceae bacterium]